MSTDLRFNASHNATLYEFARSYTGRQPANFAIDIAVAYSEKFGGVGHLPATSYSLIDIAFRYIFLPTSYTLDHWKNA